MKDPALVCPQCGGDLDRSSSGFSCRNDALSFPIENGIGNFILPERKPKLESFLTAYRAVRAAEGWSCDSREAFERLPDVQRSHPHRGIWRVRKKSAEMLAEDMKRWLPDNASVLDAGAGNGWLSLRLLKSGFRPIALDISDDRQDGLGVLPALFGEAPFPLIRAEFDKLPFRRGAFDAVIFNASLHYSDDPAQLLLAVRDLIIDGGCVYVLDSPEFRFDNDGEAMIRERMEEFRRRHGVMMPAVGRGYLLSGMSAGLERWYDVERRRVRAGVWFSLSRMKTKLRRGSDAAHFPFLVFRKRKDA